MRSRLSPAILWVMLILLACFSASAAPSTAKPERSEGKTAALGVGVARDAGPAERPTVTSVRPAVGKAPDPAMKGLPRLGDFVEAEETEHFSLYAEPDSFALRNVADFAGQAEELLQEMSGRIEGDLGQRVSFYLYSSGRRDFGGLSFFSPPLIYLEYSAKSGQVRTKALIGHELTHLISMHSLGYPDSLLHLEGVAQWASEPYWTRSVGESFDGRVRRYLTRSKILPLADLASDRSLWQGATQLLAYDEAGSFVGYLIENHGLGQFKRVYKHANYEEVYGESLQDLESDWLAYLKDSEDTTPDPPKQSAR